VPITIAAAPPARQNTRCQSMVLSTPRVRWEIEAGGRAPRGGGETAFGGGPRHRGGGGVPGAPPRGARAGDAAKTPAPPRRQTPAPPVAGRGQPALDRPDRTAEHLRRRLVGPAFQLAEDHRRAEPLGKPVDLLVHERLEVVRALGAALRLDRTQGGPVPLELASPRRGGTGSRGDPEGHAVPPARPRVAP